MDLKHLLEKVKNGEVDIDEACGQIKIHNIDTLSKISNIDPHRMKRTGIPEAIYAPGKDVDDLVNIAISHLEHEPTVIITRASDEQLDALKQKHPVEWNRHARIAVLRKDDFHVEPTGGVIGIITAGTVDIPVAEEAKVIAQEMGVKVHTVYDVGAAGIHRLFPPLGEMLEKGVDAIVVAAGREGTLPTIVSGMVDIPVIGVPVSSGYGAGGGGTAALHTMLQSCSVLSVVNIDAGFVAGAYAARIANMVAKARSKGQE
ncbi:MAG: nickel pincer cofactor biosynthesis protein LarB [ANME-2 cluster archaeon]|nr:MAG: nickel pincer cofactor biosynthesis protein LarB [ANME-2 cluster archaeon]